MLNNLFKKSCSIHVSNTLTSTSVTSNLIFKMGIALLVLLGLNINLISCQIPSVGSKCPEKVAKHSIDMRELTGQWYEVEASPLFAEGIFMCTSIKVSPFFEDRSEIKVEAIEHGSEQIVPKTIAVLKAHTSHATSGTDGRLNVSLDKNRNDPGFEVTLYTSDIRVLATDYKNWALIWSCVSYKKTNARAELVWILSRQRTLNAEHYQSVRDEVTALNLEGVKTKEIIQTGCTGSDYDDDEANQDI